MQKNLQAWSVVEKKFFSLFSDLKKKTKTIVTKISRDFAIKINKWISWERKDMKICRNNKNCYPKWILSITPFHQFSLQPLQPPLPPFHHCYYLPVVSVVTNLPSSQFMPSSIQSLCMYVSVTCTRTSAYECGCACVCMSHTHFD